MLLVIWVVRRMDQVDGEPRSIRPTPQLLAFGIWLLYCVIRSNLDVVSRIWSPDLPIRPAWPAATTITRRPQAMTRQERARTAAMAELAPVLPLYLGALLAAVARGRARALVILAAPLIGALAGCRVDLPTPHARVGASHHAVGRPHRSRAAPPSPGAGGMQYKGSCSAPRIAGSALAPSTHRQHGPLGSSLARAVVVAALLVMYSCIIGAEAGQRGGTDCESRENLIDKRIGTVHHL